MVNPTEKSIITHIFQRIDRSALPGSKWFQNKENTTFVPFKSTNLLSLPLTGHDRQSFTVLASVDSTNNYAMGQVHAGLAKHGEAWFAREQHSGRGQRSKQWVTQPGENIILSTVVEPFLLIQQQFALSAAIALACHRFFSKYAGEETKLKWPNDLYWRDRKAGGILVENVLKGQDWKFAIAGMGININQTSFPDHLTYPVSLKQITGKTFDR